MKIFQSRSAKRGGKSINDIAYGGGPVHAHPELQVVAAIPVDADKKMPASKTAPRHSGGAPSSTKKKKTRNAATTTSRKNTSERRGRGSTSKQTSTKQATIKKRKQVKSPTKRLKVWEIESEKAAAANAQKAADKAAADVAKAVIRKAKEELDEAFPESSVPRFSSSGSHHHHHHGASSSTSRRHRRKKQRGGSSTVNTNATTVATTITSSSLASPKSVSTMKIDNRAKSKGPFFPGTTLKFPPVILSPQHNVKSSSAASTTLPAGLGGLVTNCCVPIDMIPGLGDWMGSGVDDEIVVPKHDDDVKSELVVEENIDVVVDDVVDEGCLLCFAWNTGDKDDEEAAEEQEHHTREMKKWHHKKKKAHREARDRGVKTSYVEEEDHYDDDDDDDDDDTYESFPDYESSFSRSYATSAITSMESRSFASGAFSEATETTDGSHYSTETSTETSTHGTNSASYQSNTLGGSHTDNVTLSTLEDKERIRIGDKETSKKLFRKMNKRLPSPRNYMKKTTRDSVRASSSSSPGIDMKHTIQSNTTGSKTSNTTGSGSQGNKFTGAMMKKVRSGSPKLQFPSVMKKNRSNSPKDIGDTAAIIAVAAVASVQSKSLSTNGSESVAHQEDGDNNKPPLHPTTTASNTDTTVSPNANNKKRAGGRAKSPEINIKTAAPERPSSVTPPTKKATIADTAAAATERPSAAKEGPSNTTNSTDNKAAVTAAAPAPAAAEASVLPHALPPLPPPPPAPVAKMRSMPAVLSLKAVHDPKAVHDHPRAASPQAVRRTSDNDVPVKRSSEVVIPEIKVGDDIDILLPPAVAVAAEDAVNAAKANAKNVKPSDEENVVEDKLKKESSPSSDKKKKKNDRKSVIDDKASITKAFVAKTARSSRSATVARGSVARGSKSIKSASVRLGGRARNVSPTVFNKLLVKTARSSSPTVPVTSMEDAQAPRIVPHEQEQESDEVVEPELVKDDTKSTAGHSSLPSKKMTVIDYNNSSSVELSVYESRDEEHKFPMTVAVESDQREGAEPTTTGNRMIVPTIDSILSQAKETLTLSADDDDDTQLDIKFSEETTDLMLEAQGLVNLDLAEQ